MITAVSPPTRLDVADRLRNVIDSEVGLNIVDLGLIYDVHREDGDVTVRLTMTTPACPMTNYIKQEFCRTLQDVQGLHRGVIETVWEPAWSPRMIDPEVRRRRFPRYR